MNGSPVTKDSTSSAAGGGGGNGASTDALRGLRRLPPRGAPLSAELPAAARGGEGRRACLPGPTDTHGRAAPRSAAGSAPRSAAGVRSIARNGPA